VRDWLNRKSNDTVEEAVDEALRVGQQIPAGVRAAFPGPFARHQQALGGHAAALAGIGVGDRQRVGGFSVRRVGPDAYRIETEAGAAPSRIQTAPEKAAGYVHGDAAKIASYIQEQSSQAGLYGRQRQEALARAAAHEEPSWMDAEGQARAQAGFAALPEGTPVVSLEDNTHGRVGKIVKDDTGRNRVVLEGEQGFASGHVEPLDERLSWRAERRAPKEQQGGLFE